MSESQDPTFAGLAAEILRGVVPYLNDPEFRARALSDWMRVPVAAAYLGMSEPGLRTLIQRGLVPVYRPTERTVRLRRADLDAWLEAGRVDAG